MRRLIASFCQFLLRPSVPSVKNFHAIYVALTRIKNGANFRVIGKASELNWLDDLRPPIQLLAFFMATTMIEYRIMIEQAENCCVSMVRSNVLVI